MAAELERSDIISDDALMAPLVLNKNFETLYNTIVKLKAEVGKNAEFAQQAKTISGVGVSIEQLVANEKELVKVQNQLASAVAKDNDAYVELKKKVDEANASAKTRIELGERDAKTIDKTNASLKELEAALKRNRVAYSALSNEEARATKEGKALLTTIQNQDKQLKSLKVSMGQHQENVGNYSSAIQGLDGAMGGAVTRTKMLGDQLMALMKSPIVAFLAILVGLFVALKSAATTYYETTAEGEERAKQHKATWDAFTITLNKGWASIGKAADEALGDEGISGWFKILLGKYAPGLLGVFILTEQQTQKLAKNMRNLLIEHAKDVVDDANTEVKANALLEISRDKLNKTAEERQAALKKHNDLRKEQLAGDLILAKGDIDSEVERLKILGRRVDGQKLISEMTEKELKDTGLMEEEIKKLASLQAAKLKVESDASAARIGLKKLEKALDDEIHKERIDALNAEFDKDLAIHQAAIDARIMQIQNEVIEGKKIKADGDKEIAALIKANSDDLIQSQIDGLNKILLSEELTAEERAAIEIRLAKLKVDLNNAIYNQVVTLDEVTVKSGKTMLENLRDVYVEFTDFMSTLFSSISEERLAGIDSEMQALEEKTARELELAGENEEAKRVIEESAAARREQLEKKKRAEQIKQAKFDKANAIITSVINTKLAYTAALSTPPGPPYTIPNANLAAILGGIQTAAIIASAIPAFEKGTDYSPEGIALVGERGAELKVDPSGKMSLTPGVPTLDYLKEGTKIIPHDQTMKMLALSGLGSDMLMQREQSHQIELARSLNKIEKNTRKLGKSSSGNLYAQGSLTYEQKIKEDRSKILIRRTNLGY